MVILYFKYGDHSNRLFQNLHFEAFCLENNINYINPSFANMQAYYKDPCRLKDSNRFSLSIQPAVLNFLKRLSNKFKVFPNIIHFDNENTSNAQVLLKAKTSNIYAGGWYFRNSNLLKKYQDHFTKKYSLKEDYYSDIELLKTIIDKKNNGIIVVGVHIRRGDYKTWMSGKYHFEDSVFLDNMRQLQGEINQQQKETFFIIFSNEQIKIHENENVAVSKNEWFIDHHLMSCCNYLIGPPSTFTLWASYIGKVPYYQIPNKDAKISLNSFKYCNG
ncbi:MAG: hypothetical protein ACI9XP_000200 [Lentimonas sp.]|jgi:hypothetical protein